MNTGILKRFLLVNNQRRSFHYYTKQKLDKIKIGFRTVGKGSVDFQKNHKKCWSHHVEQS